jgi:drug/metabolite transporter (DMT)-like permease
MSAVFLPRSDAMRAGLATMGIVLASIGFGLVPFFARALTAEGMAPHAIAFFRYAIAATTLLPVLWMSRAQWRTLAWGLVAGAAMGLGWIGYVRAVEVAPVSTVGMLYMTYPVFTLLIAWLGFGDRPGRRAIIAAVMIVAAAVIASSPSAVSVGQLPALGLSLAAPLGFGFGINVLVHKLSAWIRHWRGSPRRQSGLGGLGLLPLVAADAGRGGVARQRSPAGGWWRGSRSARR